MKRLFVFLSIGMILLSGFVFGERINSIRGQTLKCESFLMCDKRIRTVHILFTLYTFHESL